MKSQNLHLNNAQFEGTLVALTRYYNSLPQ